MKNSTFAEMIERPAEIQILTKDIIRENIDTLIQMSRQINHDYWTLDHYLADLDKKWELSRVVCESGEICGFIIVSSRPESLHVNRIVVSAKYRNRGIGKLLIDKAIEDAKQEQKPFLTLKVDEVNEHAIGFYKSLKFEIIGKQGELLLMSLNIHK